MSAEARNWCRSRGVIIEHTLDVSFLRPMEPQAEAYLKPLTYSLRKHMLQSRSIWFQKPLVCLKSPFDHTLWLDLDCEVCGNLYKIFTYLYQENCEFAICKDSEAKIKKMHHLQWIGTDQIGYNSAVFAFKKGSVILQRWVNEVMHCSEKYLGDQNALTYVLQQNESGWVVLPDAYNWHCNNPSAEKPVLVRHWPGSAGKDLIRKSMP